MKNILLFILVAGNMLKVNVSGEVYRIRTAEELARLSLKPGDRVVLERGMMKDENLVLKGSGTATSPIYLTADAPGSVILGGSSSLEIDGSWLIVDGLYFKRGSTGKKHVIRFSETSENCRLTNTAVVDYSNKDSQVRNSWIVVLGRKNRVDHCYTEGKTNSGPTLHVGPTIEEKTYFGPHGHRIDRNYFAHRPPLGRNGAESIVIGSGKWYNKAFHTLIEYNIFERCDGESEVISTKAVNNTIRYNLFYESKGMLYLRHGDANTVYGNYFIGNNVEGTGGVHIIGKHQRVYDNYFQGLTNGIIVRNGWPDPPSYTQVDDVQIENNTLIDCRQSVVFGWDKDPRATLSVVNSSLQRNVIVSKGPGFMWTNEHDQEGAEGVVVNNNTLIRTSTARLSDVVTGEGVTLKKNRFGIYEQVTDKAKEVIAGSSPKADVEQTLFKGTQIGLTWMKQQKKYP